MFRNPCHKCIVKIRCSQTCDTYENFAQAACITICILSAIIVIFYLYLLYLMYKYLEYSIWGFAYSIFVFWISSTFIYVYALKDKPDLENIDPFLAFLAVPWFTNVVILTKLTKKYFKRAGYNVPKLL